MTIATIEPPGEGRAGPLVPDELLAARATAGDPAAFEVLMRRHNRRVYRTIRSYLRDEDEVEDAMQEAYVRAWRHLRTWTGEAAFSTWLLRIASNEALGRLRAASRRARAEEAVPAEAPRAGPDDRAAARELLARVEGAIDALPPPLRRAFILREVEELPGREVAALLGTTVQGVRLRVFRARRALSRALGPDAAHARRAFAFEAPRCDRVVAAVLERIAVGER